WLHTTPMMEGKDSAPCQYLQPAMSERAHSPRSIWQRRSRRGCGQCIFARKGACIVDVLHRQVGQGGINGGDARPAVLVCHRDIFTRQPKTVMAPTDHAVKRTGSYATKVYAPEAVPC